MGVLVNHRWCTSFDVNRMMMTTATLMAVIMHMMPMMRMSAVMTQLAMLKENMLRH